MGVRQRGREGREGEREREGGRGNLSEAGQQASA